MAGLICCCELPRVAPCRNEAAGRGAGPAGPRHGERMEGGPAALGCLSAFAAVCLGAPDSSLLLVSADFGCSSSSTVCGHLALETVIQEEAYLLSENGARRDVLLPRAHLGEELAVRAALVVIQFKTRDFGRR